MQNLKNSITKYLKPSDIANEARMKRTAAQRQYRINLSIIIVEGTADQLLYTTILDETKCIIILGYGKNNVINAIDILLNNHQPGVLGLLDDDYDSLEGRNFSNNNIVVSDQHDLESFLISSSALEKLLCTLLLPEKRQFLHVFSNDIREKLIELGSPIGHIRWLSNRENLWLDFKNIYFNSFIDVERQVVDSQACITEILARNNNCTITKEEINNKLREQMELNPDPWLVCQGHDLIKIFYLIITTPRILSVYSPSNRDQARAYIERVQQKISSEARVTEQLIMCYEQDEFRKTKIYSDIKNWEERNPSYCLVKGQIN